MKISNRESKLHEALKWYVELCGSKKIDDQTRRKLKPMLSKFEKNILQPTEISINILKVFKIIILNSLFQSQAYINDGKVNTIYFWPFQFYHCDFMLPIIKHLQLKNEQLEVLVSRKNLQVYLQEKGVTAIMINHKNKTYPFNIIIKNLLSFIRLFFF